MLALQEREDVDELLRLDGFVVHSDDERLQCLLSVCQSTKVQLPPTCVGPYSLHQCLWFIKYSILAALCLCNYLCYGMVSVICPSCLYIVLRCLNALSSSQH